MCNIIGLPTCFVNKNVPVLQAKKKREIARQNNSIFSKLTLDTGWYIKCIMVALSNEICLDFFG